jgi:hypothetical protein
MRFLVAVRPGLMSPTLTARMVASFDQMSEGRLLINVVTGGDPVELAADGLLLDHDERYRLTDEFLTIFRGVSAQESVDFKGQHLEVRGAKLLFPGVQKPYPDLYFGGSSPAVRTPLQGDFVARVVPRAEARGCSLFALRAIGTRTRNVQTPGGLLPVSGSRALQATPLPTLKFLSSSMIVESVSC